MSFDKSNAFVSGEPGTTGREPFEQGQAGYTGNSGNTGNTGNTGNFGNTGTGLTGVAHTGEDHLRHGAGHEGHSHSHSGGLSGNNVGQAQYGGQSGAGLSGSNYGSSGQGQGGRFDQTGNTVADSEAGATHHQGHGHSGHGIAAAAAGATGAGHHNSGADVGSRGQEGSGLAGSGYDSTQRTSDNSSNYESDRVGALGQQSGNYDRTGAGGPVTHGAAGTDRFDSDRSHGNASSGAGFGPGGERHTEYGGNTATGYGGENDVDKREKAAGTGGVGGILGTTDKEFTGRDRLGGAAGAYGDEAGHFKGNSSGPSGNSALTGREGTYDNNPVAKAESKVGNEVHPTRTEHGASTTHGATGTGATGAAHGNEGQHEKKGIVEKIKDALH